MTQKDKSPWSNIPKMSRLEASKWKVDPRNRRMAKKLREMELIKQMMEFDKRVEQKGFETIYVDNPEDMVQALSSILSGKKPKGKK